jgi:imidazolonepropionase-like amidohydrolase
VVHVDDWEDVRHAAAAGATAVTHVPGPEVVPADVLALMVEHGTSSIPTLAVQLGVSDLTAHPEWLDLPLARAITTPTIRAAYQGATLTEGADRWRAAQIERKPAMLESVRLMFEAGIPILVGTDSGNLGTIQGWSVHHELMKLVEAGLSAWDALAAGSTRAAAFLGHSYGVAPGAAANLVILEASPLDDITNTQRIVHVIHAGVVADRSPPVGG